MIRDLLLFMLVVVVRRSISVTGRGRRRNGVQTGRFVRPDEQHTAGCVVHDESGGPPQAVGPEP